MLKRIRSWLPTIIPLAIVAIFALIYRNVLRNMLLVPLAYLIYIVRVIAYGVGQQTLWISFVLIATVIAALSLIIRREEPAAEPPPVQKYPTRLQAWIQTVSRKERSQYFKWTLAQDLSNLLVEAIAYHQGLARSEILRQIETGQIDLPPDIRAYLRISQKPFIQTGLANYANGNWLLQIRSMLHRRSISKPQASPLDLEPEKIIHYLEDYLGLSAEIWQDEPLSKHNPGP